MTIISDGRFRVTASRQDRGLLQIRPTIYADIQDGRLHLAMIWIADTTEIYEAIELHFRRDFRRWRDGCTGFRPRCRPLRLRAEQARDDLYSFVDWAARTWSSLSTEVGPDIQSIAVPAWLDRVLNDPAEARAPALEHWL